MRIKELLIGCSEVTLNVLETLEVKLAQTALFEISLVTEVCTKNNSETCLVLQRRKFKTILIRNVFEDEINMREDIGKIKDTWKKKKCKEKTKGKNKLGSFKMIVVKK